MSLRSFAIALPALYLIPFISNAQQDPPPATPPAATAQAPFPPPASSAQPDYPDPRTFTIGIGYWVTVPGNGPTVAEGKAGTAAGTLSNLGGDHRTPWVEVSMPITRTGVLHFEGFISKGDGNQILANDASVFSAGFNKGDALSTQYNIEAGKLYLDDLLHPFKFPVARFRLKSLWEIQYIQINSTVDAPFKPPTTAGQVTGLTGTGAKNIIFPTFGLAAEYDIAPHVTFRIADGEATISYRRKQLEFVGGAKVLHFKTSPKRDQYFTDTIDGGFIGLRWHF